MGLKPSKKGQIKRLTEEVFSRNSERNVLFSKWFLISYVNVHAIKLVCQQESEFSTSTSCIFLLTELQSESLLLYC